MCLHAAPRPAENLGTIRPQDLLLSHEPTRWFRRHQFFGLGAPFIEGHKLPQTLWKVSLVEVHLVAVYKLWDSREVGSSVQFLIHASSSICICLVWRICMTPGAFLMCAASVSERVLAEPFWIARDLPKGVLADCNTYTLFHSNEGCS